MFLSFSFRLAPGSAPLHRGARPHLRHSSFFARARAPGPPQSTDEREDEQRRERLSGRPLHHRATPASRLHAHGLVARFVLDRRVVSCGVSAHRVSSEARVLLRSIVRSCPSRACVRGWWTSTEGHPPVCVPPGTERAAVGGTGRPQHSAVDAPFIVYPCAIPAIGRRSGITTRSPPGKGGAADYARIREGPRREGYARDV